MGIVQFAIFGLVIGSYIAISTIGFTLIYGLVNMINFAHGEYMMIGGYVGFLFAGLLGLQLPLAILLTVPVSAVIGWVLARLFFEPLYSAGPIPLLLTSIGLGYLLRNGIRLVAGQERIYFESVRPAVFRFDVFGGFFVNTNHLTIIGIAVLVFLLLHALLVWTDIGIAMRATADNDTLARVTGIDTNRIRSYVWILASGLAGLSGVLIAEQRALEPELGIDYILLVLTAAILGGAGSPYGAIAGSYVIGLLLAFSAAYLPSQLTSLGTTVVFTFLIVVLLVRPGGIAGAEVRAQ